MSVAYSYNIVKKDNGYIRDKFDWKNQSCECCPYGYHIDLDFVRYCATVLQQSENTATMNKRKERRRQRQSMEMLLGVTGPTFWTLDQYLPQIPQEPSTANESRGKLQVSLVEDALEDVVSDFEQTFQHSKQVSNTNNKTNNLAGFECLTSPIIKQSILEQSEMDSTNMDKGLSAYTLKIIRKQLAIGLERIKELETKVKHIPKLQDQIAELRDEKVVLLEKIKQQNVIIQNSNQLVKTIQPPQSPIVLSRKDVGTMCNVITRHIGVGPQHTRTRSISTSPCNDIKYHSIDNLTMNDLFIKPKQLKSQTTQTHYTTHKDIPCQTVDVVKDVRSIGMVIKPSVSDAAQQIVIRTNTVGVSDDTIYNICSKCNISKHTIAVGPSIHDTNGPVSLMSLSVSRSKSFCLGEEKLSNRHTISCQTENFSVNKSCQSETKLSSKYSQYEWKNINRGIQTEVHNKEIKKDIGCNTKVINRCNVFTNTDEVTNETNKQIKSPEVVRRDDSPLASRIPRPATFVTSHSEHSKFQRQNTYTKIVPVSPTTTNNKLSGLDLSPTTTSQIDIVNKEVSNLVLPDQYEYTEELNSSSSHKTTEHSVSRASLEQYHGSENSGRQKAVPSREMQAAMKVLNDALHKSDGGIHIKNQVKSAIDIIQQQWFKISSLVNANPLDVEDYLDSFEEISSTLLEYIVNMTDDSGNTAMHYAVSHGNFDVVSILLDSKVCNINQPNKAGYTSVMLVSLAEMRSPTHATVVRRLFHLADVNIRAKQHGQTALMLAVSHGRLDMVQLLLEAGADINIQDEDGSTSLMCAAEHGHIDIIKYFLSHPDCDSTITDVDGSTALKISLEAGHKDIGVLLYAHEHSLRGTSPYSSLRQRKLKGSTSSLKQSDSS